MDRFFPISHCSFVNQREIEHGEGGDSAQLPSLDHTNLGSGIDGELELALLAVLEGELLHEEGSESRSRST